MNSHKEKRGAARDKGDTLKEKAVAQPGPR